MSPLANRHIVVTRPAGQAAHLAQALAELGAKPVLFPVLAIFSLADQRPLLDAAARLDEFDWAVFVSPNAVDKALAQILPLRPWPQEIKVATIGHSSEEVLRAHGVGNIFSPKLRFDSEALLDLPELQAMAGKKVVIFRGDGGREVLGDTLAARGASVEYVACYARKRPALDPAPLWKLWGDQALDAVTLTSSEGLRNLYEMVGKLGQAWLRKTPVFVPHARIFAAARALDFRDIILTAPGDDGLIAGLLAHFAKTSHVV